MNPLSSPPQLLALDWGTSSLRAFLMAQAKIVESRQSAHGIQHLPEPGGIPGYERAFAQLASDWLQRWPRLPIVASGMVGSAQGWREAPYVRCPADTHALAKHGVRVSSGLGPDILIAPGVLFDEPSELPDVMRGEEIQIAGALSQNPAWAGGSCFILPGTHSKWARIENGRLVRYSTYLTGELFAVLSQHSILGRLMPARDASPKTEWGAFELGLRTARDSGGTNLSHQVFATRTLGLAGRLPYDGLADYLSGLLIGHELVAGLATLGSTADTPLILIGAPALCRRYVDSLQFLGRPVAAVLDNTAPDGLWNFAQASGLINPA